MRRHKVHNVLHEEHEETVLLCLHIRLIFLLPDVFNPDAIKELPVIVIDWVASWAAGSNY